MIVDFECLNVLKYLIEMSFITAIVSQQINFLHFCVHAQINDDKFIFRSYNNQELKSSKDRKKSFILIIIIGDVEYIFIYFILFTWKIISNIFPFFLFWDFFFFVWFPIISYSVPKSNSELKDERKIYILSFSHFLKTIFLSLFQWIIN